MLPLTPRSHSNIEFAQEHITVHILCYRVTLAGLEPASTTLRMRYVVINTTRSRAAGRNRTHITRVQTGCIVPVCHGGLSRQTGGYLVVVVLGVHLDRPTTVGGPPDLPFFPTFFMSQPRMFAQKCQACMDTIRLSRLG